MFNYRQDERLDDAAYFSRRAAEEANRAMSAATPAAQRAHFELAAIFDLKSDENEAQLN